MPLRLEGGGPLSTQPNRGAPSAVTGTSKPLTVEQARAQLTAVLKQATTPAPASASWLPKTVMPDSTTNPFLPPENRTIQNPVTALYEQETAATDSARQAVERAVEAQRSDAMGSPEESDDQGFATKIKQQTKRMTAKDYEALTPLQQWAVDANGSLVRSVRRDRNSQEDYEPSPQEQATYDVSIQKIFGKDYETELFAPETVALLQRMDFTDTDANLEDFLGLKVAIRAEDLAGITEYQPPAAVRGETPANDRADVQRTLAVGTQRLETAMAEANRMLGNTQATVTAGIFDTVNELGGNAAMPKKYGVGYGPPQDEQGNTTLDGYFQMAMEKISRKGADVKTELAKLEEGSNPGEMEAFMSYVNSRLEESGTFGTGLGADAASKYYSSQELQALLGMKEAGNE